MESFLNIDQVVSGTPVIRWAGSKRRLLPRLAEYWNKKKHARYLEPFAGSGALYFHLQPENALLNDLNVDLISMYRVLASDPEAIYKSVKDMSSDKETYYRVRSLDPKGMSDLERAARFIYLNRFCFNGIYRTNKSGDFNVPYGGEKSGALPSLARFIEAARLLRCVKLSSIDFDEFVRRNISKGDFVYLDPPYAVGNRRIFRQYDPQTFGISDLERLSSVLDLIDEKGGTFLVSYALSAEVSELTRKWASKRVVTQRNIAGFSKHRRKAVEVMITNLG